MPRFDKEYSEYLKGNCENYNQPLISALEEMEKGGDRVKCKICKKNKAEVQDRNDPLNKKKTICKNCHAQRLMCDMTMILALWKRRRLNAEI